MSNDLPLNSLDRFTKQSPRLVLERHSHCEIPAGCGGIVLRWRNPRRGLPVVIRFGPVGELNLYVGGKPCIYGRTTLPFGDSVLALHLAQVTGTEPVLLGVSERDTGGHGEEGRNLSLLSTAADETWLATAQPPPGNWNTTEFDDRAWDRLRQATFRVENVPERQRWHYERLIRQGAVPLALPQAAELWVRKRFRLEETD